jgi:hypothetical protein
LVLTPLNITVIRFTQEGIDVKSMLVPDVLALAVPDVIALLTPMTETVPVPAGIVAVKLLAVFVGTSSTLPPLAAANLTPII